MGMHRRWSLLVGSATAVIALAQVATPSASAAPAPAPRALGHLTSYVPLRSALQHTPFDAVFGNVDYNGGPVMPSNTDYMVLWSPSGLGAYGPEYVSGLEQWFKDLAHDSGGNQNTDSVSAQYNDLTGAFARYAVTFGGAVLDTNPYPTSHCPVNAPVTNCLTDPQIQRELEDVVAAHHLKTDLSHEYFLFTPPHVEGCFTGSPTSTPPFGGCTAGEVPSTLAFFCAYHQNTSPTRMLLYADDPFVVGNPGCDDGNHPNGPSDGALIGGLSHEQNESVSDPLPNDAWTNGAGATQGFEIGDLCGGVMGKALGTAPDGAKYNQVINGHFYWYQTEWSNQRHTCLQRLTLQSDLPTAQFTATAASGLTMSFDATGSTAPGGVADYVWQFNDLFGAQTVEMTTPTVTHTFPAAGAYSIGLTIFAHNGLSIGTGAIVTTGQNGFSSGFTFSPANPAAGHSVSFSALTTVSNQPVINYMWEFGDGSTGTGATPRHEFAKAGTYTVTLVMFSGTGSAFPGQGAGPIVTHTVTVS
jgi:PKD repeat protein